MQCHEIELIAALADDSVIDTNPSNNNIIRDYYWQGVPDLVAKTFETISSPTSSVGQEVELEFKVSNEGTGSAVSTINNHLFINGQEIGVIPLTNLNAGYTATITFGLIFNQPGNYSMLMHVNKNSTITESNYNNNTMTNTARVRPDVTDEFTSIMRQNAAYMAYYASLDIDMGTYPLLTGEEFASKVRTGGDWDYKLEYGYSNEYIYDGRVVTGEDMGNFHYGFVGRGATFGEELLLVAAGAYQIYGGPRYVGWWESYFDDPNDQAMIIYGISMWDNNSWPSGTINEFGAFSDNDAIYTLTEYEKRCIEREISEDAANLEKLKDK